MITYEEENATKLSATKKDFYQIWNELLDKASLISERWDPASTNESDPGIVLLKVLTAVADKLNYEVDMNALEAFMPSAAQEESMRKLTEMLGYNMKYYQSATTDVQITYNLSESKPIKGQIWIDKFTNIKDIDDTINYVTLQTVYFNSDTNSKIVPCIEGELIECETDDDNIISMLQLDDNNRYYLPEVTIAENGIFITNLNNGIESDEWEKVYNLNTQQVGKKCFKFGYDSKVSLPYIQFPNDISVLIEDGLRIKYIRTNGINGNISPKTLYKMEKPVSWSNIAASDENKDAEYYKPENYIVSNPAAAKNGTNIETLNDAYSNYKKIIGTFDTLVTCRDYMNKIYQLTADTTDTINLVSNIIVADLRDDINKSVTLCTFGDYGIEYNNIAKRIDTEHAEEIDESRWNSWINAGTADDSYFNKLLKIVNSSGIVGYGTVIFDGNNYVCTEVDQNLINNFDLIFYPFKNVYGLNTKLEYTKSFKYDDSNIFDIKEAIEANKTLSHNILLPNKDDIACIKNYYNLNAKITTTRKVNELEQKDILKNVYTKLYENFNMRKVEFGEELSYDHILEVIETADPRIKNVSLEDPTIITKFCTVGGGEYNTSSASTASGTTISPLEKAGDIYYNKAVLNNVLAGRIPLFNYDENFKPEYNEAEYPAWQTSTGAESYKLLYPDNVTPKQIDNGLSYLVSEYLVSHDAKNIKLNENEVIQFRLQNLKTVKTYPAYVNYFMHLDTEHSHDIPAIPATMKNIKDFLIELDADASSEEAGSDTPVTDLLNNLAIRLGIDNFGSVEEIDSESKWDAEKNKHFVLYKYPVGGTAPEYCSKWDQNINKYYYLTFNGDNYSTWDTWIKTVKSKQIPEDPTRPIYLLGLYWGKPIDISKSSGYLIDEYHRQFLPVSVWRTSSNPFTSYYVQNTHESNDDESYTYTADGLGQDGHFNGVAAGEEYKLSGEDYLLINYTSSTSTEGNETKTVVNEIYLPTCHYINGQLDQNYTTGIIKPNFDLADSTAYRTAHNYSKTTGFDFSNIQGVIQPDGMFTLGPNEQIETRDFIKVTLDKAGTNIYWERHDEVVGINDRIYFEWNEDPYFIDKNTKEEKDEGTANTVKFYSAYTLKDGEYFYYTNQDKNDIAYYGAGTKIKRTPFTPDLYKSAHDSVISAADIATYGLSAAIPWRPYSLNKDAGEHERKLQLIEYQYRNLSKDNILNTIEVNKNITNDWQVCTGASFTVESNYSKLPPVSLGNDIKWEVRSRLNLNVSQIKSQQLFATLDLDNENNKYKAIDSITLYTYNKASGESELVKLEPQDGITLSIKANKTIQSSMEKTPVTEIEYSDNGGIKNKYYNCQIKVFSGQDLRLAENSPVNMHNFGNGKYTKVSFNGDSEKSVGIPYVSLNAIIPANRFGLLMIQNNKVNSGTEANNATIRFIKSSGNSTTIPAVPAIYNNRTVTSEPQKDVWWDDKSTSKVVWATEGTYFGKLTQLAFNTLKTTLYTRLIDSTVVPTNPGIRKRYDYATKTGYSYTKVTASTEWDENAFYCQLLDEGGDTTVYILRNGINIVKIEDSCNIQIYPDGSYSDIIIFSDLDIVYKTMTDGTGKHTDAINPKLNYKIIGQTTEVETNRTIEDQILADIKVIDPNNKFYYNTLMNNDTALDLNTNDEEDTMENPLSWYNYNNVANKFVISEINADYLPVGITIARNSKL